jgi:hypothetical protein
MADKVCQQIALGIVIAIPDMPEFLIGIIRRQSFHAIWRRYIRAKYGPRGFVVWRKMGRFCGVFAYAQSNIGTRAPGLASTRCGLPSAYMLSLVILKATGRIL